jgi:hypothetical protein
MSQFLFEPGQRAVVRLGVSPLWETLTSMWALLRPGRYVAHHAWVERARPLTRHPELAGHVRLLKAFMARSGNIPDFLSPPPPGPAVDISDELAILAATPHTRIAREISEIHAHNPYADAALAVGKDPLNHLPRLIEALGAWHEAAIAPHWPRWRALLADDIEFRARQLQEGGVRQFFTTLHPSLSWSGDRLVCDDPWEEIDYSIGGREFVLTPGVFVDRHVLWNAWADSQPSGIYPARSVTTLWQGLPSARPGSLAKVLGPARAHLLAQITAPATTTVLSRQTGLSPAGVSQHLTALVNAGLARRVREGREVYYSASPLGEDLLRANGLLE